MSERAALTRTPENKGKNPVAAKPKENLYESMDSPVEQIFHLQRTIGNQAVQRLLKSGTIQAKLKIGKPNDKYEQEADRVADQVMRMPEQMGSSVTGHWSLGRQVTPSIQRQEQPEEEEEKNQEEEEQIQTKPIGDQIMRVPETSCPECNEEEKIQTKPITENITPIIQRQVDNSGGTEPKTGTDSDKTAAQGLIVEDSITELGPGQMKKSQFLAQLQAAVYSTVESALEGTGHTAEDCPYIKYWFMFYKFKNSQYIERAVHKYAPETSRAASARDYISIITVRVRMAAMIWAKTGKITGVPKDIPTGMRGTGLIGGLVSKIGSILFKARSGGPKNVDNLQTIQAKLGSGRPLDSGVSSRIGSAFGQDFSHVRIHTDAQAAQLSDSLNARAFTIGKDIAFAHSEYRPGTLVGDALIAHELAHTIQQRSGSSSTAPMKKEFKEQSSFEEDADLSAIGAVASLWGGIKGGFANIVNNALPTLRSGLRLQRCVNKEEEKRKKLEKAKKAFEHKVGYKKYSMMRIPKTRFTINIYPGGIPSDPAESLMPGIAKKRPGTAVGVKDLGELLKWIKYQSKKRKSLGLPHQVEAMSLLAHGLPGEYEIGDYSYDVKTLKTLHGSDSVGEYFKDGAIVIFSGCNVAAGEKGEALMKEFGRIFFGKKSGILRGNTCIVTAAFGTSSCKPVEFRYPEMKKFTPEELVKEEPEKKKN